jgi:hypothetical protein
MLVVTFLLLRVRPLLCKRFFCRATQDGKCRAFCKTTWINGSCYALPSVYLSVAFWKTCRLVLQNAAAKSRIIFSKYTAATVSFMQTRPFSAVRWLDITVADRSVWSLQSTWSGSLHSSEIVLADDGWFRYGTVYIWGEEEESSLGYIIGGLQFANTQNKSRTSPSSTRQCEKTLAALIRDFTTTTTTNLIWRVSDVECIDKTRGICRPVSRDPKCLHKSGLA